MRKLLRGLGVPPVLVGAARGLVEAAVIAALGVVIVEIGSIDLGGYGWLVPLIIWGARTGEGLADQIDPEKKRTN